MPRIRVVPENLQEFSRQIQQVSNSMQELDNRLAKALNSLEYEARQRANIDAQVDYARNQARSLATLSQEMSVFLSQKAQAFAEADGQSLAGLNSINNRFDQIRNGWAQNPSNTFPVISVAGLAGLGGIISSKNIRDSVKWGVVKPMSLVSKYEYGEVFRYDMWQKGNFHAPSVDDLIQHPFSSITSGSFYDRILNLDSWTTSTLSQFKSSFNIKSGLFWAGAGLALWDNWETHKSDNHAAAKIVVGTGVDIVAGKAAGAVGAAIGTVLLPGIGGPIGYLAGSFLYDTYGKEWAHSKVDGIIDSSIPVISQTFNNINQQSQEIQFGLNSIISPTIELFPV